MSISLDQRYRLSCYAHEFRRGDIICLYHSLTIQTIYLPLGLWNKVRDRLDQPLCEWFNGADQSIQEATEQLINEVLLVPEDYDETQLLSEVKEKCDWGEAEVGVMYLVVTDQCNFSCDYCFVEAPMDESYQFRSMSPETANSAVDLFHDLTDEETDAIVIFYGGEPLLNWPAIEAALERLDELNFPRLSLTLNTNGSLVTDEIATALADFGVTAAVSLDGPEEMHDQARRYRSGKATYLDAMSGYNKLKSAGANTVISVTVGDHNLDRLEEVVFPWAFDLEPGGIGYNLLLGSENLASRDEEYARRATEALIKFHEQARDKGLGIERALRKVLFFANRWIYPRDCAGCGKQIVVAPDGSIGPCHAFVGAGKRFFEVDYADFNLEDHPVWQEWSKRSPLDFSQCHDCPALGICGGGCAYNAELITGSIRGLDPGFCVHAKMLLEWMIWDLYDIMLLENNSPQSKPVLGVELT